MMATYTYQSRYARRQSPPPEHTPSLVSARLSLPPFAGRNIEEMPLPPSWDEHEDSYLRAAHDGSRPIPFTVLPDPIEAAYQADQRDAAEYVEEYGAAENVNPRRSEYIVGSDRDPRLSSLLLVDKSLHWATSAFPLHNASPLPRATALQSHDRGRDPGGRGVRREAAPGSKLVQALRAIGGSIVEPERSLSPVRVKKFRSHNFERQASRSPQPSWNSRPLIHQEVITHHRHIDNGIYSTNPPQRSADSKQDYEESWNTRDLEEMNVGSQNTLPHIRPAGTYQEDVDGQSVPLTVGMLTRQQLRQGGSSSRSTKSDDSMDESDYKQQPASAAIGKPRAINSLGDNVTLKVTVSDRSSLDDDGGGERLGPRQIQFKNMNHKFGKMMFADSVSGDSLSRVLSSANETISKDNTKECARQAKLFAELGPKHRTYWANGQLPQEREKPTIQEIREEVIISTVAERRSQAAVIRTPPPEIDREFLEALSDGIRDEIILEERQYLREREERIHQANTANSGAITGDMDPAAILATLPPALRTQVLLEEDEEILALLPQELAEQVRAAKREHPTHGRMPGGFARRVSPPGTVNARAINTTRPGAPDPSRQYVIPPPPPMSPPAQQNMMSIPPPSSKCRPPVASAS